MSESACPHCGESHPTAARFCPNSGQAINAAAPQAQAFAPQPQAYAPQPQQAFAPQPQAYAPQPQQAYAPQPQAFAPQPQAFAPQPQAFAPQPQAYAPQPQAFAPQPQAYAPQPQAYAPQPQAYAPQGFGGVRHSYPLAMREASVASAVGLVLKSLPFALARFGALLGVSVVTLIWYVVAFGGWALLANRVHAGVGLAWFLVACSLFGSLWWLVVRYFLYLLKCGHIAVLTELMTQGTLQLGGKSMFAYGKDVVRSRFGEVNVLFAVDQLVAGVVRALNRTLDFIASLLPIPGLSSVMGIVNGIIYSATTYLDETIFSYGLARKETNPWSSARDGLIYYAQNSKEILKTAAWIVVLDKIFTVVLWAIMLVPAFVIAWILPSTVVSAGFWFAFGFAALLASNVRAAFLQPVFLVMVMHKFHVQVQNQALNAEWDQRLSQVSDKFREISGKVGGYTAPAPALAAG